ncbi:hypothetical protein [Kitasatospora sp. A2-31]|uniref:hypothetical protein n=1 Tax=Kitasatospora sp. A2-31 TaxID=2916414 RepID=UPI001EEBBE1C|nr:hypothetical protein [Kitasatospora sp. A2-31]MCG6494824.1 hypothetical protein [Kitasatospora sp. A2-31]
MMRAARRAAAAGLALTAALGLAACGSDGSGKAAAESTACDGVVRTDRAGALLEDGAAPTYRLDRQLDATKQAGLQLLDCTAEAKQGLGLSVRLTGSETPEGAVKGPDPQPGEPVYSLGFGDRSQVTQWGARLTFRCDGTYARSGKPLYFTVQAAPSWTSGEAPRSPASRWTAQAWARLATDSARRAAGGLLGCSATVAWPSGEPVLTAASGAASAGSASSSPAA